MVIRVDGLKAVIIEPPKTRQQFIELLNWCEYKNRTGLRDAKGKAA